MLFLPEIIGIKTTVIVKQVNIVWRFKISLVEKLIKTTGGIIEKEGGTVSFIQNFAFWHFI